MPTEESTVLCEVPEGNKDAPKETYRIFDFMKEHTTFLVACVSGCVAVVSFCISLISLMYQRIFLQPWNISAGDLITFSKGSIYSFFVSTFIYSVAICWMSSMVETLFIPYYYESAMLKYKMPPSRSCRVASALKKAAQNVSEGFLASK